MTSQTSYRRNFLLHLQERREYDGPVLSKEPKDERLTSSQIAQLHNKHAITRQLVEVPGVRPVELIIGGISCPISKNERMQMAALTA